MTTNEFLYAGTQFDSPIGQYYDHARDYDASAGQFTSRDSYNGELADPITENHYLYAGADPVENVDPSGHFDAIDVLSAISLGVNIGFTGYDAYKLLHAKTVEEAALYSASLTLDLALLLLPFAGPLSGGGGAALAVEGVGAAGLSLSVLEELVQAQRATRVSGPFGVEGAASC